MSKIIFNKVRIILNGMIIFFEKYLLGVIMNFK